MTEDQKLKETLSALLDGEAGKMDQLELRRLARALEERPEFLETYRRYVIAQAVIKGDRAEVMPGHLLLAKVRAAIDGVTMDEPEFAETPDARTAGRGWLLAAGRIAIAASVAVVAVYLVQVRPVTGLPPARIVETAMVVPSAIPSAVHNTRLREADVLAVSAGSRRDGDTHTLSNHTSLSTVGCVISLPRVDNANRMWEKKLPAGYVLCKQNAQTGQCESSSAIVSCYQE